MSSRAWAASAVSWSISDWERELRDSRPLRRFSRRMISLPGSATLDFGGGHADVGAGGAVEGKDDVHRA